MKKIIILTILISLCACKKQETLHIPSPVQSRLTFGKVSLTKMEYQDKILGALAGSAIGDAMGASTEMWHRNDIQNKHGYITGHTPAIRQKSPEGTWDHNMPSGSTTDDTRWKMLVGSYLINHHDELDASRFSNFIVEYYQRLLQSIPKDDIKNSTDALDQHLDRINWIKEWARVALGYEKGREAYDLALHRFYGGEMACAGLLYGPMFGLSATDPYNAYITAYHHAIFDLGYARDITALAATMTYFAVQNQPVDSIIANALLIDPMGYTDSRLVGRLASKLVIESMRMVADSRISNDTVTRPMPTNYPADNATWTKQNGVYNALEKNEKSIPFHAGEIWQILIAGLDYGNGDFQTTLEFIVNYGRDNDTVAAIAGMILGARLGYEKLPDKLKQKTLEISQGVIGIDLQKLAEDLSNQYWESIYIPQNQ